MSCMSLRLLLSSVISMGPSLLAIARRGRLVSRGVLLTRPRPGNLASCTSRQFYDLIEIFRIGGPAPDTNYLFLGMLFPYCAHAMTRV